MNSQKESRLEFITQAALGFMRCSFSSHAALFSFFAVIYVRYDFEQLISEALTVARRLKYNANRSCVQAANFRGSFVLRALQATMLPAPGFAGFWRHEVEPEIGVAMIFDIELKVSVPRIQREKSPATYSRFLWTGENTMSKIDKLGVIAGTSWAAGNDQYHALHSIQKHGVIKHTNQVAQTLLDSGHASDPLDALQQAVREVQGVARYSAGFQVHKRSRQALDNADARATSDSAMSLTLPGGLLPKTD